MKPDFYGTVRSKATEYFLSQEFEKEIITNLLEQAIQDLKENLNKFNQCIESKPNNLENLATLAHTIKGVLVNMGLEELGAKFKNIQNLILNKATREEVLTAASNLVTELGIASEV